MEDDDASIVSADSAVTLATIVSLDGKGSRSRRATASPNARADVQRWEEVQRRCKVQWSKLPPLTAATTKLRTRSKRQTQELSAVRLDYKFLLCTVEAAFNVLVFLGAGVAECDQVEERSLTRVGRAVLAALRTSDAKQLNQAWSHLADTMEGAKKEIFETTTLPGTGKTKTYLPNGMDAFKCIAKYCNQFNFSITYFTCCSCHPSEGSAACSPQEKRCVVEVDVIRDWLTGHATRSGETSALHSPQDLVDSYFEKVWRLKERCKACGDDQTTRLVVLDRPPRFLSVEVPGVAHDFLTQGAIGQYGDELEVTYWDSDLRKQTARYNKCVATLVGRKDGGHMQSICFQDGLTGAGFKKDSRMRNGTGVNGMPWIRTYKAGHFQEMKGRPQLMVYRLDLGSV